jgi:hypothetical protein
MSLATPRCVQKLQTASPRILINPGGVCLFREPDAGNLPVRFDEREQEIESSQTGLRRAMRKHSNSHREAKATAPVLDSTRDFEPDRPILVYVMAEVLVLLYSPNTYELQHSKH